MLSFEQVRHTEGGAAEEVMLGEMGVVGRVAVEDVDEDSGVSVLGWVVVKTDGGGPNRVEVILDCFGAADALGWKTVSHGVADEKGIGQGEKVLVRKAVCGETQLYLACEGV